MLVLMQSVNQLKAGSVYLFIYLIFIYLQKKLNKQFVNQLKARCLFSLYLFIEKVLLNKQFVNQLKACCLFIVFYL